MAEEILAQLVLDLTAHADQRQARAVAEEALSSHERDDHERIGPELFVGQSARQIVDG